MHSIGYPIATVTTATQVADLLAAVAAANGRLAAEADRIANSRAAIRLATIDRLTRLGDDLRPAATARAQLAQLDPELLLAGTSVWLARRRAQPTSPTTASATDRAAARWGGASA
jgi:acyl-CoA reductase-like NAD-dependent aldehyde dehydrogenase